MAVAGIIRGGVFIIRRFELDRFVALARTAAAAAAIALSAVLMVLAVYVPLLQDLLSTEPVSALRLAEMAALAVVGFVTVRLTGRRAGARTST